MIFKGQNDTHVNCWKKGNSQAWCWNKGFIRTIKFRANTLYVTRTWNQGVFLLDFKESYTWSRNL